MYVFTSHIASPTEKSLSMKGSLGEPSSQAPKCRSMYEHDRYCLTIKGLSNGHRLLSLVR